MRTFAFLMVVSASFGVAPAATGAPDDASPLSPQQVEEKALTLLKSGKQAESQHFLAAQAERYPEVLRMVSVYASGASRAEKLRQIGEHPAERPDVQRVFFLLAACTRSRFEKEEAFPLFQTVFTLGPKTPAGLCAEHVVHLDSDQFYVGREDAIDREFAALASLADGNSDDVVIRWMLAVQCRTWNENELGVEQYKEIVEKWNPGPVLIHQTYANLLDELKRYEEALSSAAGP